jgi:2-dehydro-3-deoxygalactonokinase
MTAPALIGIDWGTTSFRAYLLDGRGTVLDNRSAAAGILQVDAEGFEAVMEREIGEWLGGQADLPVILSGMIGSRQGWVEVPYVPCPTEPRRLADELFVHGTSRGRRVRFVPGLLLDGELPDVLRGEETEIIGAMGDHPEAEHFVLPGTHSKWVFVDGPVIREFATFMTGEVFAVLKLHSILGRMIKPGPLDDDAFTQGATVGLDLDPLKGGLLHRIFSARTLALTDKLVPEGIDSYLSGLLIGCEVREALLARGYEAADGRLVLVGGSELVARYNRVLGLAGISPASAAPAAAARGLFKLAQLGGLLD